MNARHDLRWYWCGQTASAFGSVFTAVAIPVVAVVEMDAGPNDVALISAASMLPALLLGLPAGALADRIARPRRALLVLDTIAAVIVGLVALGVSTHVATVAWFIFLAASLGCLMVMLEVVYFIHLSQVTGADNVGPARARLQAGQFGAGFVGRLLAGPTIVVLGGGAALAVDAASYVLSLTALLSMTPVPPLARKAADAAGTRLRRTVLDMANGIRFFLTGDPLHRTMLVFFLVPAAAMAAAGAVAAPLILRVLHVPTAVYGLLFAASGVLGLAGSVVAGRLLRPGRPAHRIMFLAMTASLACGLLLPAATGPLPVAATFAALGISLPVFFGALANVTIAPILVTDAAESTLGSTVAALKVLTAACALGGALVGGLLAEVIGIRPALFVLEGGGLAVMALSLPAAIRTARRQPESEQPQAAPITATR